jgi:hypothetical protein
MDVETAGYDDYAEILKLQNNQRAADSRLRVVFEETELEDKEATEKEGRPIFKTVHIGSIYVPGDKDNVVTFRCDKMSREEAIRFGPLYEAWKKDRTERHNGTLLRECGGLMSRARAREWECLNVYTVEDLAELSDSAIQQMRHGSIERQKAKDFLALAAGRAPLTEARAENAKLKEQLRSVQDEVKELRALLEERTNPNKKVK